MLHRILFTDTTTPALLRNISELPPTVDSWKLSQAAPDVVAHFYELLGEGRHGRVWRGSLSTTTSSVVVKTFENKELALREALFCERAPKTISHLIPGYFGLYARPDESWFALVMEDVGESLQEQIDMDWDQVKEALGPETWYVDSSLD